MSASTVHELQTLLASRHPLVVLESSEEDRVRTIAKRLRADMMRAA